jgi:hypothetical protein
MKKNTIKENDYSLLENLNYNETFDYDESEVIEKYILLTNEYLKFILETTKIKNNNYFKFIIIRGYDTISNIFNIILYYTKNLDLTFYHCQKAYYYYTEFMEQITDEQHIFLQLTSRDATTYVYKQIFSELLTNKINLHSSSNELKQKLLFIEKYIKLFNNIFVFIIEKININEKNLNIIKNNYFNTICKKLINLKIDIEHFENIYNLVEKINKSYNDYDEMSYNNILNDYFASLKAITTSYSKYNNNTPVLILKK